MKLTQAQRKALHIAIIKLAEDGPADYTMGICWNLNQLYVQGPKFLDVYAFVSENSVTWPGRTGDLDQGTVTRSCSYPIKREYDADGDRLPLWEGMQGDARRSLIRYLMAKVA